MSVPPVLKDQRHNLGRAKARLDKSEDGGVKPPLQRVAERAPQVGAPAAAGAPTRAVFVEQRRCWAKAQRYVQTNWEARKMPG